jgi:hypothetical protein
MSKQQIVILKLDFEKAFDKVEHGFMLQIIEHKGFPTRSLNWMRSIFAFGTYAVVLNGVPSKIFHYKRRVRQGDPSLPSFLCWQLNFYKLS